MARYLNFSINITFCVYVFFYFEFLFHYQTFFYFKSKTSISRWINKLLLF